MVKHRSNIRIVAALLVVLAAALTVTAVVHAGRAGDAPSAVAGSSDVDQSVRPLSVLFVGDSFTFGAGVQDAQDAYAKLIAQTANWDLHVDAQGATGFIADGQGTGNGDTSRLIDRLAADKANFPNVDLLVVDAGRNDLSHPPEEIADAVSQYLSQARGQWPDAKIVEIFPAFVSPTPPDNYRELASRITMSMNAVDGTLVDPVGEGWYADIDPASMVEDGVHPDWRGNIYIAHRLIASLRQRGVIPAG